MRPVKMLGLLAIAAIAAMALVGATSAMATGIQACKNDPALVAECERVTSSHFESVGHLKLVTQSFLGTVTIECNGLLQATLPNELAASSLTTSSATLTYSNCLNGCSAKVITQGSVSASLLNAANETSDVTVSGFEVLAECVGLHCIYNGEKLTGSGLGPLKTASGFDEVTYTNAEVHKVSGTFCPETSKLSGVFRDLSKIYPRE